MGHTKQTSNVRLRDLKKRRPILNGSNDEHIPPSTPWTNLCFTGGGCSFDEHLIRGNVQKHLCYTYIDL